MALKVWLPLNGDLKQQGISNLAVINNNATVNTNGKIGSCYAFNGSNQYMYIPYNFYNPQYSVCAWIYTTTNTATQTIVCDRTSTGYGFSIFLMNNGKLRLDPGGNNKNLQWITLFNYPTNTWFHLTVTYNGSSISYYINGEFKEKSTKALNSNYWGNVTSIGVSQGNGGNYGNYLNGRLNDIRIYDHCLSAAEVKEISQGLILHYKLDDINNYISNENLMPNSDTMALGSANPATGTWRNAGTSNMTRTRVLIENNIYGFQNSGIQTANDGSCYGIDNFPLKGNTLYCISMKARKIDGTGDAFAGFNIYAISQEVAGSHTKVDKNYRVTPLTNEWTECWYIIKTNANTKRNIYIGITTGDTSVTTQMCQVKIQEVYQFENNNIIQDSSGYNHNGAINGNIQIVSNTSRYNNCIYSANGSSNYIQTPTLNMPTDTVTLNIWFKSLNKAPTSDYHMVVDSIGNSSERQHYEMAVYKTGYFRGGLFVNGARKADNCTTTTGCNGNWHMLTLSYDGTAVKRYFDGIMEKSTSAAITTGLQPSTTLRLFKDGYSSYACKEASISDFRIYATALSADDILQLYHTSAKVDNKQNLHTFELVESNSKIQINKQGQTLCNELEEDTATKFYKVDEIIETNEFIEF